MDDDYEDYSYYRKPRMQLAAGKVPLTVDAEAEKPSNSLVAIYSAIGVAFLAGAFCTSGVLQFMALWLALSFLIGPHAPPNLTCGNCSVGQGEELPLIEDEAAPAPEAETQGGKRGRQKRSPSNPDLSSPVPVNLRPPAPDGKEKVNGVAAPPTAVGSGGVEPSNSDGGEWTREEWERLKKALLKLPRGTPQRWQRVVEFLAAGGGKLRKVEEVVQAAKDLAERKPSAQGDAFTAFLANRKAAKKIFDSPLSMRDDEGEGAGGGVGGAAQQSLSENAASATRGCLPSSTNTRGGVSTDLAQSDWTAEQDRVLMAALRQFPKESTPNRWEKVAEAVGGERSKQQCYRRFCELRGEFRSKKGGGSEEGVGE